MSKFFPFDGPSGTQVLSSSEAHQPTVCAHERSELKSQALPNTDSPGPGHGRKGRQGRKRMEYVVYREAGCFGQNLCRIWGSWTLSKFGIS